MMKSTLRKGKDYVKSKVHRPLTVLCKSACKLVTFLFVMGFNENFTQRALNFPLTISTKEFDENQESKECDSILHIGLRLVCNRV